jgi:hypothetical protein
MNAIVVFGLVVALMLNSWLEMRGTNLFAVAVFFAVMFIAYQGITK